MPRYAKGSRAWGECRRSGKRLLLRDMVRDGQFPNMLVAPDWYEPRHPQERLISAGDGVALYNPAPETGGEGDEQTFRFPAVDPQTFQAIQNPIWGFTTSDVTTEVTGGAVTYVDSLCSYTQGASSPIVMGIPPAAQVGDLLVVTIHATASVGAVTAPTGWNLLGVLSGGGVSADYLLSDPGVGSVILAYRFMQLGDTQVSIPISGTAASVRYGGCVHAFRNADPVHPFPQALVDYSAYQSLAGNDGTVTQYVNTPVMNNAAPGSKVLAFGYCPGTDPNPIFSGFPYQVVGAYDALEVGEQLVSGGYNGYFSLVFSPLQNELSNLLPYGFRNYVNWTATNVTVDDAALTNPTITRTDPTLATARHELSYSVNLVSGQTYSLMAYNAKDNSGNADFLYLAVDNGTTEIGATYAKGTNAYIKNGTFGGGGFLREYTKASNASGDATSCNHAICAVFTASVTGPHTIRVGNTTVAGNPVSNMGSASDGLFMWHTILATGETLSPPWGSLATTGSAATAVAGTRARIIRDLNMASTQPFRVYALEIKANNRDPDLVRLSVNHNTLAELASSRLTINDSGPGNFNVSAVASGCVDKWQNLGSGKFYFEVTPGALWESAASQRTAVTVAIPWARGLFPHQGTEAFQFNQLGLYSYMNNGEVNVNAVNVATVATWDNTAGTVIGCSVDFINNEIKFYKNGSAVYTASLLAAHRDVPLRAAVQSTNTNSQGRQLTMNFAGPMQYLPSGFLPYDWENA